MNNGMWGQKQTERERERMEGRVQHLVLGLQQEADGCRKEKRDFFPRSFRQEQEYFVRIAYTLFSTSWTFRVCASINAKRSSTLIKEALAECEIKTLQGITACAAFPCNWERDFETFNILLGKYERKGCQCCKSHETTQIDNVPASSSRWFLMTPCQSVALSPEPNSFY